MFPDRYYVAEVREGPKVRRLYFYASVEGLTDPEYGYTEDDSWIEPAYRLAVKEVERTPEEPGATVTVSESREINSEELMQLDPAVNGYILKAIGLAKEEIGAALHPIRMIWYWQVGEEVHAEIAVHMTLSDDVVTLPAVFGLPLPQLCDESLMRERIRRLYRKLVEDRSRKLVLDLLRMNAVAAKD